MYICKKNNYDFNFIFNKFHELSNPANSKTILPIHEILYYPNSNKFMDITTITYSGKNLIDEENKVFLFEVFSTDAFINQLNFSTLSPKDLEIMINAINYTLKKEREKINYFNSYIKYNKFTGASLELLAEQRTIIKRKSSRIKFLEDTLNKLNLYHQKSINEPKNPNKTK